MVKKNKMSWMLSLVLINYFVGGLLSGVLFVSRELGFSNKIITMGIIMLLVNVGCGLWMVRSFVKNINLQLGGNLNGGR